MFIGCKRLKPSKHKFLINVIKKSLCKHGFRLGTWYGKVTYFYMLTAMLMVVVKMLITCMDLVITTPKSRTTKRLHSYNSARLLRSQSTNLCR